MKYYALTVGPISKTLGDVRKTRHLWGGSYLFSFLMKQVWLELTDDKHSADVEMLQPAIPKEADLSQGVGFFPDKLMFASSSGKGGEIIRDSIKNAIDTIAKAGGVDVVRLRAYLQTYVIEMDIPDGKNIMETLNHHLEYAEQRQSFVLRPVLDLNTMLDKSNGTKFYNDAGIKRRSFQSLAEIATEGLRRINSGWHKDCCEQEDDNDEDKIMSKLEKKFKTDFFQHHKYVAVVYADGDNVSNIVNSFGSDRAAVRTFCEKQFNFANAAVKKIKAFGAAPVYAGGDDLLFFAPVAVKGEQGFDTFLHLLNRIEQCYREEVSQYYKGTSISFGVAVFYYKYPLYESLNTAKFNLLEGVAKKRTSKNTVAMRLLKHSGHAITATIAKNEKGMPEAALDLLSAFTGTDKDSFLSSLQYRLGDQRAILEHLLAQSNAAERLDYFFKHNFNEPAHSAKSEIVKKVKAALIGLNTVAANPKEAIDNVSALLRLVQFINAKSKTAPYDQLADQLATAG